MSRVLRWLVSFRGVVWAGTVAFTLYLTLGPLVQNYWARYHWDKVPCHVNKREDLGYFYMRNGVCYRATRPDFWALPVGEYVYATQRLEIPDSEGQFCYVNPKNPKDPVLRLDADTNLAGAWKRGMVIGLLVAAAFGVTYWKPSKQRGRRGRTLRPGS